MDAKPRRGAGARADFLAWNLMRHQAWKRSNPFKSEISRNAKTSLMAFLAQVRPDPQ